MAKYLTSSTKYVFLDVVGFTKDRSVEAQADIIAKLNQVVSTTINYLSIPDDKLILLPTGDGLCIALLDISKPYDIHLLLAKKIVKSIAQANKKASDLSRSFQVRIGINENVDNIVKDINERENVAGVGINMAQRIMNCADGGQILVGQIVYDTLSGREKYIKSFRKFEAVGKHNIHFSIFQYLDSNTPGLNMDIPSTLVVPTISTDKAIPKLTKNQAYYFAYSWLNQDFLLSRKNDPGFTYASVILLHFLALDAVERSGVGKYSLMINEYAWVKEKTFEQQYDYYETIEFHVISELAELIQKEHFSGLGHCFEEVESYINYYIFLNDIGRKKLQEEWPAIVEEFGLLKL